jgi:hypothetical protein
MQMLADFKLEAKTGIAARGLISYMPMRLFTGSVTAWKWLVEDFAWQGEQHMQGK